MFTYDENIFSDFHKDAYGFRPREYHEFWDATPERKQEIWDMVADDFEFEIEREAREKVVALERFNALLEKFMTYGAADRTTALRWMTEDSKFYNEQDVEHFVWNQGILFTAEGRALVKELVEIVKFEEYA